MQADMAPPPPQSWWDSIRPYLERAPLAALLLGISSGFPYAMIGATLTTRLSQDGFEKSSITAFSPFACDHRIAAVAGSRRFWRPVISHIE